MSPGISVKEGIFREAARSRDAELFFSHQRFADRSSNERSF
jgi:hypothetical protein